MTLLAPNRIVYAILQKGKNSDIGLYMVLQVRCRFVYGTTGSISVLKTANLAAIRFDSGCSGCKYTDPDRIFAVHCSIPTPNATNRIRQN